MVKINVLPVKALFEDQYLLVIDKPSGLVVDKSETQLKGTLEEILTEDYGIKIDRGGIVHRLDKDTSGVLLVAKTAEALENLQSQFANRRIKKEYLSLVHGLVETPGKVERGIGRNPGNREKFTVLEDGKEALTEYEPVQSLVMSSEFIEKTFPDYNKIQFRKLKTMNYPLYTLLAVRPKTGRTHQIRVHLKYINHPIVCDEKYVGRKIYRLDKRWCLRLFLHAKKIGFYHPNSGEWMEVESELPDDLKKVLEIFHE